MKKYLSIFLLLFVGQSYFATQAYNERETYSAFLKNHPFSQRERLSIQQLKAIPKRDRPDLAWEQNYLATLDPALGYPTPERLLPIYQQISAQRNQVVSTPGGIGTPWVEKGPDNVGGRTRAVMYDPNTTSGNKVWAGGVTGGLWYNNDVSSATSQWVSVNDFWDNIAVTAIAYDPNNTQIFYVGTGEGWGTGASRGAGIWKSINGGTSWTQISATSGFYYVNDLVVRNESGTSAVYAAVSAHFFRGQLHGLVDEGLQRSTDGGTSWAQVLPNVTGATNNYAPADLELAADNRIWVGTNDYSFGGSNRGGGTLLYSDDGTSFTIARTVSGGSRVKLACAPSNSNYVYMLTESSNQAGDIAKSSDKGVTWSTVNEPNDDDPGIPTTDFTRGQAWYDLSMAVDPNDEDNVFIGGIDLFKTTNGGTSWTQISHWYGGFGYPEVHADQHQIVFKPNSSSEVLFTHDGGVSRTTNATSSSPSFTSLNRGYNVTQFYACAIHPIAGSEYALAGAQDNGSQQFNTSGSLSTSEATGGDGAYCFIDQNNPNYQITSYVYNSYFLSSNGGNSFNNTLQRDLNTGKFINPTDYDDNQKVLFSSRSTTTINRISNITGVETVDDFTVSGMNDDASHLRVSPYTTTSTTLFVGTDDGDVFKVTNADGNAPSSSYIGTSSFPNGSVSCIELGANENEILVTFTNYGITSVWYTSNGGTSWSSKEGDLPDMPVRWALFNPNNRNEVILATEVGIWSTTNFNAASPSWSASSRGMANVRVDMLQIRASDNQVLAATYGRGLFTSDGFSATLPPTALFAPSSDRACSGQTVALNDSSEGAPTGWQWSISPTSFTYVNGTSATSQNPEVQFSAVGTYSVTLTASNVNGNSTISEIVEVGGITLPFTEDFEGSTEFFVNNPDNATTWQLFTIGGTSPGNQAAGIDLFNYNTTGERDQLISPVLDFAGFTNVTLNFEYAYRRYDNTNRDSMALYISTDCGSTFSRIASYSSDATNNFATGADVTSAFTPAVNSDWCNNSVISNCPSINLNTYAGLREVQLRWESINGYGNNLYIDNINVAGTGTVAVVPTANFNANTVNPCQNVAVTFTDISNNTPTGWSWTVSPNTASFINGTSATSQNPEISFNNSGVYQVSLTATNSAGSDVETKVNYITVAPSVALTTSIAATNTTTCSGKVITFTASSTNQGAAPTYQWKINGNNAGTNLNTFTTTNLQNNDVVTLELTSSESCAIPVSIVSNSITMTILPSPSVNLTTNKGIGFLCKEDTITLTGTPAGGTYGGNGVVGNSFIAALAGDGNHMVHYAYTAANGCTVIDSVQLAVDVVSKPTITISNNILICNQTVVLYQWLLNGANAPGQSQNQTYAPTVNGIYTVEVLRGSCSDVSDPFIGNTFSVEEAKVKYDFSLFPNPAKDKVLIEFNNTGNALVLVELYDFSGALVKSKSAQGGNAFQIVLLVNDLATGIYTLKVTNGNTHFIEKLEKF